MQGLLYFRVHSVLLNSTGGAAVTLNPVEWTRMVQGGAGPEEALWDDCTPLSVGAEPYEPGGAKTELRFDVDPGWRPQDFVTVDVTKTATNWRPGD